MKATTKVRLTGEELRRAALARSARRSAAVANRRLVWRWTLWYAGRGLRWGSLPALAIAGGFWWWQTVPRGDRPEQPRTKPVAPPASARPAAPAAPAASSAASTGEAAIPVYLRLDASIPAPAASAGARPRQAQSPSSAANEGRLQRER